MIYNKPTKTIGEQIDLLKKRGLIISNEEYAKDHLSVKGKGISHLTA